MSVVRPLGSKCVAVSRRRDCWARRALVAALKGLVMTVAAWLRRRRSSLVIVLSGLVLVAACSGRPSDPASTERSAVDLMRAIDERFELHGVDRVRAVVVLHDGETVLEDYRDTTPETTWDLESVTKSVLSVLVGHAIGEGVLSLDQTLAELLPEHVDTMARWQQRLTLSDLLTHSGGFCRRRQDVHSDGRARAGGSHAQPRPSAKRSGVLLLQ